jgi:peptidoglycan/xylan/chitin deacetylase (PgdA/CDA1 family)
MPFWPERVAASIRAARPVAREGEIEAAINRLKPCTSQGREEIMAALPGGASSQLGTDGPDKTLSWAQIAEMDRSGVIFGAHTQTHQVLTSVPESTARQEIRESKAAIEHALNKRCDLFAYPNGDHSRQTQRLLAEAGFALAFTTKRGAWTTACDPLAIPRPNISDDDVVGPMGRFSPAMFAYTVFWKAVRAAPASGDLP